MMLTTLSGLNKKDGNDTVCSTSSYLWKLFVFPLLYTGEPSQEVSPMGQARLPHTAMGAIFGIARRSRNRIASRQGHLEASNLRISSFQHPSGCKTLISKAIGLIYRFEAERQVVAMNRLSRNRGVKDIVESARDDGGRGISKNTISCIRGSVLRISGFKGIPKP